MRITNKTIHNNMLRNLNQGMSRLDKYQQQLASGKRVQLPSDDPAAVASIMQLKTSLTETAQYLRNVEDAISWLESTDSVLDGVTSVVHRARELTVYGANDTLDRTDRHALALEIEQLFDNVFQLSNSTHGGKYLFAGQKTLTRPFDRQGDELAVTYAGGYGDSSELVQEIGVGSVLGINIIGAPSREDEQLFQPVFRALARVHTNLLPDGDANELGQGDLVELDQALNGLLRFRSEAGAKVNRLELAKERLTDLNVNLSRLLSHSQDVDMAETIMHLKAEENIYQTALSVGARIIQPSLLDFLR